jgi:hypothetical protein
MNEPAFPGVTYITLNGQKNPEGMTLRDYFAARAMQGFQEQWVYDNSDDLACKAYALADAMLKARQA